MQTNQAPALGFVPTIPNGIDTILTQLLNAEEPARPMSTWAPEKSASKGWRDADLVSLDDRFIAVFECDLG